MRTVPDVRKAVKWNLPFYGIEGQGGFLRSSRRVSTRAPGQHVLYELGDHGNFPQPNHLEWCPAIQLLVRQVEPRRGCTLMLVGLGAPLEHNIRLNLTVDCCPKLIEEQMIGE